MRRTFDVAVVVAVGLMVAVLAIGAALNSRNIRALVDDMRRVQHTHEVREKIADNLQTVTDAAESQRTYLLTGRREYLDRFEQAAARFDVEAAELSQLIDDNDSQSKRVAELTSLIDQLTATLRQGIKVRGRGDGAKESVEESNKAEQMFDQINHLGSEMREEEGRLLAQRERRVSEASRFALVVACGVVAIGLVFFWGVLRLIRRNLSDQLTSAAQLSAERERLRVTLDSIGDGVIATDNAGRVTFLNSVAERMTGWPLAEAKGQHLGTISRTADEKTRIPSPSPMERLAARESKSAVQPTAILQSRGAGELLVTERAAPIRDEHGDIDGAVVVLHDVTDERRHSQAIRDREDRIRLLLDSTAEGIYGIDLEGRCTFCNASTVRMLGYSRPEELLGQQMHELIHSRDLSGGPIPRGDCKIHAALITGAGTHCEDECFWRADGEPIPVEYWSHPVSKDGELVGAVVTFLDVSERKRADQARAERARLAMLRAEVSANLVSDEDHQRVLSRCLEAIVDRTAACGAQIWTDDQSQFSARLRAGEGLVAHDDAEVDDDARNATLSDVASSLESDLVAHSRLGGLSVGDCQAGPMTADFPLLVEGKTIGLMAIFSPSALSEREAEELEQLVDQMAQFLVRRHAEEALAENERQFTVMADSMPQLAWMARPDGHVFWFNQRWFEFTGTTLDQVEGWGWERVQDPAELTRVRAKIKHSFATGQPWEDTFPIRRRDGVYRWHLGRMLPIRDGDGRVVRWFGTNTDVTEEREAAEALRESEERFRQLADAMRTLAELALQLGVLDDAPAILDATTQAARKAIGAQFGAATYVVGGDWTHALTSISRSEGNAAAGSDERSASPGPMARLVCQQNKAVRLTHEQLTAHPVAAYFEPGTGGKTGEAAARGLLAAPLVGFSGRNLGLIQLTDKVQGEFTADDEAILVQIAQMASVGLENVRLYRELREADKRKDQFLATLAHELRNPLAPLSNALQLIAMEPANAAQTADYADLAARQCMQLTRLIDDLLDVSRIATGKFRLHREPVVLQEAIHTALDMSRLAIADANHVFEAKIPDEAVMVSGDPVRLSQIMANLLINAAKYTPIGGRIELEMKRAEDDVVVAVRDTGIGIPASRLEDIFELFSQIDTSTTRSQGGLGIGLTLVKTLVQLHGGSITTKSGGLGQGSEFIVRLPTIPVSETRTMKNAPKVGAPLGELLPKFRILVVDDNRSAAMLLSRLLAKLGQEVRVTDSGAGALEQLDEFQPDIVMSDIAMPEMSGYDLARAIRQGGHVDVVLIALTGYGQAADRHDALEAGFVEHLVKPIAVDTLAKVLASIPVLPRKQATTPATASRPNTAPTA